MIHNRSGPPVEQKYQEVLANPCGICESPRAQINNKKPQPKTEANAQGLAKIVQFVRRLAFELIESPGE